MAAAEGEPRVEAGVATKVEAAAVAAAEAVVELMVEAKLGSEAETVVAPLALGIVTEVTTALAV